MTVPEVYHIQTDDLASLQKFYPAEIRVPHHQLRNFISVVHENRVYYVHNYDIFVIDLSTKQKSLVATVPFEARCLAANHGWVCVGGEQKGDCAFVRVAADGKESGYFGLDLIVDMLGKDIVNSMTIHKIPASQPGQRDEVVILISNNDTSVTLYSLTRQQVLTVLKHPKAMNYATMSPDNSIIAAVGDSDKVFFYTRKAVSKPTGAAASGGHELLEHNWQELSTPKIPSGDGVYDDYGFAVTFSPNGRLCAVSAQGGYISVIDMELLIAKPSLADATVMCTFKSSRPGLWGCVRSMAFSPDPWDMLAWTEDHGRIGIADVRRSFMTRQCLTLEREVADVVQTDDITPSEYKALDVKERLKQQHLQRMRNFRGDYNTLETSLEGPLGSLANRRTMAERTAFNYRQDMELDQSEQSVLEALETTMDDVEHHAVRPYSVNYTSSPIPPGSAAPAQGRDYDIQILNAGMLLHTPRRRGSVVLSEIVPGGGLTLPENPRAVMTESPAAMSEDNSTPPMSTNDLTPSTNESSQPMPYNIPTSDPWHVIEAALVTNRASQLVASQAVRSQPPALIQIESAIAAERRLSSRLERQLADERRLSALLRTEIEARERLLEARQQDIQSEQLAEDRLSPSLERVLQRQLQSEQENGRQRSTELETEIRNNSQRVDRLMSERESFLYGLRRPNASGSQGISTLSASPTLRVSQETIHDVESTVRHLEGERQARQQRIHDLETQVRRAESRVELASTRSGLERAEMRDRHHERLLDARLLSAARPSTSGNTLRRLHGDADAASSLTSVASNAMNRARSSMTRRAEIAMNGDRSSAIPLSSELSGRVTDTEMRIAREMLRRATADVNTGWMSSHGLQRIMGPRRTMVSGSTPTARTNPEVVGEKGPGTAGIGWSSDGRYLYIGSEIGIFQFKIHTRGRMCFPSVELR